MNPEPTKKGTFIILDGIDGSGKSTIITAWKQQLEAAGKSVFELKTYWNKYNTHPPLELLMEYDVIISAEPTYVGVGDTIRTEMITHGSDYTATATATAYALDRLILYTKLIVPLRTAGKLIIQDRGVSTSLCYQPIQGDIAMHKVAALEGNTYALIHAPDALILTTIPPEQAMHRLGDRSDKQDNAQFEQLSFLQQAHDTFQSNHYQSFFTDHGTAVSTIDTSTTEVEMKKAAEELLSTFTKDTIAR